MKSETKIIWAIDPLQDPKESANLIQELKNWSKNLHAKIQPVTISSFSLINFPMKTSDFWKNELDILTRKSLEKFLKGAGLKGMLPAKIVFSHGSSRKEMAAKLAECALEEKASLIFASTHAKKRWSPIRLGGFAEMLIATSRVPVLLMNPSAKSTKKISSILFPTDFGRVSKAALAGLEPWAKNFDSKIILFNQVEIPVVFSAELGGPWESQAMSAESYTEEIEKARQKNLKSWEKILSSKSLEFESVIQRQRRNLSRDILDMTKKKDVDLVALASQSGPLTQGFLGSVARDLLMQAPCPVLIFYRQQNDKVKTKKATKENHLKPTELTNEVTH